MPLEPKQIATETPLFIEAGVSTHIALDFPGKQLELQSVFPTKITYVDGVDEPAVDPPLVRTKKAHCLQSGERFWIRNSDCACGIDTCFTIDKIISSTEFTVLEEIESDPSIPADCPICRGGTIMVPRMDLSTAEFYAEIRPRGFTENFQPRPLVNMSQNSAEAKVSGCYPGCSTPEQGMKIDIPDANIKGALIMSVTSGRSKCSPAGGTECTVVLSERAENSISNAEMHLNSEALGSFQLQASDPECGPVVGYLSGEDAAAIAQCICKNTRPKVHQGKEYWLIGGWDLKAKTMTSSGQEVHEILYFGEVYAAHTITAA